MQCLHFRSQTEVMEALLLFLFFALLAIFLVMRKVVISAFSRSYEIAQFEPWKSKKEIARDEWEAENKRLLAEIKANDAAKRQGRSEAEQEDLSSMG